MVEQQSKILDLNVEKSKLKSEVFELSSKITETTDIENFPGFPEGIMGPELMSNMRSQAERFNAE